MTNIEFQAPWSRSLKMSTGIVVAMLSVLIVLGVFLGSYIGTTERANLIGLALFVLLGSAAMMVRGYTLTQDEIVIKRPGWTTRLPLSTLQSVEGKANAMQGSLRLFGIGGLFSHIGWFWNRQLSFYRVYATDSSRAVILRYPNRTIVITPHDPQQFIMRARTLLKTSSFKT